MPITKSAKKALRKEIKRRENNQRYKAGIRRLVKQFNKLVLAKEGRKAKELLPLIFKALDKAAKEKAIKKGQADRKKSRLSRRLLSILQSPGQKQL